MKQVFKWIDADSVHLGTAIDATLGLVWHVYEVAS